MVTYNYVIAFFADLGYTKIQRSPNVPTELWLSEPADEEVRLVIYPSEDGSVCQVDYVDDDDLDVDITLYNKYFSKSFDEVQILKRLVSAARERRDRIASKLAALKAK